MVVKTGYQETLRVLRRAVDDAERIKNKAKRRLDEKPNSADAYTIYDEALLQHGQAEHDLAEFIRKNRKKAEPTLPDDSLDTYPGGK